MSSNSAYEAEALGVTSEGATPGRHTLTEGFCPASGSPELPPEAQLEGGGDRFGGGRERAALRPGFGAEPQGREQPAAGESNIITRQKRLQPRNGLQMRGTNALRVQMKRTPAKSVSEFQGRNK